MSATPRRAARRARRGLGRLVPADQVRARGSRARDDRVGAARARRRSCSIGHALRGGGAAARAATPSCARGRAGRCCSARSRSPLPFLLITFGEHEVPSGLTAVLISPASLFVALLRAVHRPERDDRPPPGAGGMVLGPARRGAASSASSRCTRSAQFLGALAMIGAAAFYALVELRGQGPLRAPDLGADVVHLGHRRRRVLTLPVGDRHRARPHARRSAPSPRWSRSAWSAPRWRSSSSTS